MFRGHQLVTAAEARALALASMTQEEMRAQLHEAAALGSWLHYHTWRSDHSAKGFPDDWFLKPGSLMVAELVRDRKKVTPEQQQWLDLLGTVPGVHAYVLDPARLEWFVTEILLQGVLE